MANLNEIFIEVPAGLAGEVRSILEEDHLSVKGVSDAGGLMDGVLVLAIALTAAQLVEIGLKIYDRLTKKRKQDDGNSKITVKVKVDGQETKMEIDLRLPRPTIEFRLNGLQIKLSK